MNANYVHHRDNVVQIVRYLLPRLVSGELKRIILKLKQPPGRFDKVYELMYSKKRGFLFTVMQCAYPYAYSYAHSARLVHYHHDLRGEVRALNYLAKILNHSIFGKWNRVDAIVVAPSTPGNSDPTWYTVEVVDETPVNSPINTRTGPGSLHDMALRTIFGVPDRAFIASDNPHVGYIPYNNNLMNTLAIVQHPIQNVRLRIVGMKPRVYVVKPHGVFARLQTLVVPTNSNHPMFLKERKKRKI